MAELDMCSIAELQNNSAALDCYVWLAYRLHALSKATPISWAALYGQFGGGFRGKNPFNNFKRLFSETVRLTMAAYRDAKIDIDPKTGLILYPSKPPIPLTKIAVPQLKTSDVA